jgi:hypothetical protein
MRHFELARPTQDQEVPYARAWFSPMMSRIYHDRILAKEV